MRLISRVASSEWPPSAKKLSSMPTRSTPQHLRIKLRTASPPRRARRRAASRRGPRAPAAPAGRACRWASTAAHRAPRRPTAPCSRAGAAASMRAQRRRIDTPIDVGNHIRDQPPVARLVLAGDHRRLRHVGMRAPAPPRSPRLDPEPADLHLLRRRGRGTPAHRRDASGRGRRCGTSGSRRGQTGPPRTAPPSVPLVPHSPAQARHRQRKAHPLPRPGQARGHRSRT